MAVRVTYQDDGGVIVEGLLNTDTVLDREDNGGKQGEVTHRLSHDDWDWECPVRLEALRPEARSWSLDDAEQFFRAGLELVARIRAEG